MLKPAFVTSCCALVLTCATAASPAYSQTLFTPQPVSPVLSEDAGISQQPFANLFQDIATDFRRLPSRETLTWLGIGAAVALVGHQADSSVTRSLSGSARMHEVLESGRVIGGAPYQLAGAFAAYGVGRLTNSPRLMSAGADLVRAQALVQALTFGVKLSVRRTRPDGTAMSFPSGHASSAFASATVLQRHFGWKVGAPAYGVATYVAASRVQEKRHFFSDVAFGAALGIVAGRTVTIGHGQRQFALAPMAAPGGAGVALTWVGQR